MKLVEELDYRIDFDQLKNRCPDNLTLDSMGHRMQGLSIQHRKNVVAPWNTIDGLESLRNNYDKDCTEKDFNIVHKNFKNTEFERIVNDFNLVRSRIMLLHGKRCYSIHPDDSWRLHIPITTNPGCLFYFPDIVVENPGIPVFVYKKGVGGMGAALLIIGLRSCPE